MERAYIGGQAVIEGVMMKHKDRYAVAVRTPEKTIDVQTSDYQPMEERSGFYRVPIIRGVVNFIESLEIGMKTLMQSASFFEEEEKEKSKAKKGGEGALMVVTLLLSLILTIGLFIVLPALASEFLRRFIDQQILLAVLEGVIRLVIFILYVWSISLMQDMKRVYMYHGAEHKTINCFEAGEPLTVENVKKHSRFHKRCGTSFLFIVMLISILFFMVISVDNPALRIALRLLLVPAIAGVSYEVIRFAGRHDNWFVNIISAPGKFVQKLTTREPSDDMIEVAIASVEAVIDWKAYQAAINSGEPLEEVKPKKIEKRAKDKTKKDEQPTEPVMKETQPVVPKIKRDASSNSTADLAREEEYSDSLFDPDEDEEYYDDDLSEFFEEDIEEFFTED